MPRAEQASHKSAFSLNVCLSDSLVFAFSLGFVSEEPHFFRRNRRGRGRPGRGPRALEGRAVPPHRVAGAHHQEEEEEDHKLLKEKRECSTDSQKTYQKMKSNTRRSFKAETKHSHTRKRPRFICCMSKKKLLEIVIRRTSVLKENYAQIVRYHTISPQLERLFVYSKSASGNTESWYISLIYPQAREERREKSSLFSVGCVLNIFSPFELLKFVKFYSYPKTMIKRFYP